MQQRDTGRLLTEVYISVNVCKEAFFCHFALRHALKTLLEGLNGGTRSFEFYVFQSFPGVKGHEFKLAFGRKSGCDSGLVFFSRGRSC